MWKIIWEYFPEVLEIIQYTFLPYEESTQEFSLSPS